MVRVRIDPARFRGDAGNGLIRLSRRSAPRSDLNDRSARRQVPGLEAARGHMPDLTTEVLDQQEPRIAKFVFRSLGDHDAGEGSLKPSGLIHKPYDAVRMFGPNAGCQGTDDIAAPTERLQRRLPALPELPLGHTGPFRKMQPFQMAKPLQQGGPFKPLRLGVRRLDAEGSVLR